MNEDIALKIKENGIAYLDNGIAFYDGNFPREVGYLSLAKGFDVAIHSKPSVIHRWAMHLVFGWKWRDA